MMIEGSTSIETHGPMLGAKKTVGTRPVAWFRSSAGYHASGRFWPLTTFSAGHDLPRAVAARAPEVRRGQRLLERRDVVDDAPDVDDVAVGQPQGAGLQDAEPADVELRGEVLAGDDLADVARVRQVGVGQHLKPVFQHVAVALDADLGCADQLEVELGASLVIDAVLEARHRPLVQLHEP